MDGENFDVRVSVLESDFRHCVNKLDEHTALLEKILHAVDGNGTPGLKTRAALNESSIKRLWWVIGIGFPASITVITCMLNLFGSG